MSWTEHLDGLGKAVLAAREISAPVEAASRAVAEALLAGRRVLAFGNGGSATQSQHLAAELVVRYRDERRALAGVALTADTAILTACANDYDFESVFSRQVEALGNPGDVAFALTTSGRSPNVLKALAAARARGMITVFVTGEKGRAEAARWDVGVVVPASDTAHVQELHLAVIHAVCRAVDEALRAREGTGSSSR